MKTVQHRVHRNGATRTAPAQAKIQPLDAPAEFRVVRLRDCPVDSPRVETPTELADFWRKHVVSAPWFKDDKECLCVFLLNARRRLIGFELVSQGTLDTLLTHPREVLRPAIFQNAAAIIIAHNLCVAAHKLCYVEERFMCSHRLAAPTLRRAPRRKVCCANK